MILVLADDLTGALEAAAKFATHGFRVSLVMSPPDSPATPEDAEILVAMTSSRHLSPEQAAAKVSTFANLEPDLVYKKTDSALRGNIQAELGSLHRAFPDSAISFIPWYPEFGRTTRDGRLHIDGVPVHLTDFARDPLNPVTSSAVADVAGAIPCEIHDGESTGDVDAAVHAVLARPGRQILAGPASVAAAIASCLRPEARRPRWPKIHTCLVVNGSRHARSTEQVDWAARHACFDRNWRVLESAGPDTTDAQAYAGGLAAEVMQKIELGMPDALLIFGGDTALAILEAMGRPCLDPLGEIVTGVPVSRISGSNLYLVTKAGSFGPPELICQLKTLLHGIQ